MASQNHKHRCPKEETPLSSYHQSYQQSHSSCSWWHHRGPFPLGCHVLCYNPRSHQTSSEEPLSVGLESYLFTFKLYTVIEHFPMDFNPMMEKAMASHSSTLAWKIPWVEEPGRLQSMGSLRVRHDWATSLSLFTFVHWRRKWQPTPVFLPGESWGWGSLLGCRLWGPTESDMTGVT